MPFPTVSTAPPMARAQLLQALRERQFHPFLQPIVCAAGRWQGAEILMRWQHPQAGLLVPGVFIARLAEQGLLAAATRQMLQQLSMSWTGAGLALRQPFFLSFNACADQLRGDALVSQCEALLHTMQQASLRLMIEMPERGGDIAPAHCRRLFSQCEQADIAVALDDFGIGDARLHQLASGRISCLKLDRSFVAATPADSLYSRLIEKIVALAAVFNASVTAEGVETLAQWQWLRSIGVRRFQGYYFARPLAAADFLGQMVQRRLARKTCAVQRTRTSASKEGAASWRAGKR